MTMKTQTQDTFPCADSNSTHEFAMERYWVTCKHCRVYRVPHIIVYGESKVAPKNLTNGKTDAELDQWINKLNARYIEEDNPR